MFGPLQLPRSLCVSKNGVHCRRIGVVNGAEIGRADGREIDESEDVSLNDDAARQPEV